MVVFRDTRGVNTPPRVSMPKDRGVTSKSSTSFTSPRSTPPWIAAPMATTSSGFTPRDGSFPKKSCTLSCTLGMRVMPPTRMTSWISLVDRPASFTHFSHGDMVRCTRSSTMPSNWALVIFTFMCFGPEASAVMKGRDTSVWFKPSSSRLAFSAASRMRCMASRSPDTSMPLSFLNSATRWDRSASSKSSPPRRVSPFVALTSKTPPEISRIDTSKVPPPRSNTAMS
mmetsp:Transcript_7798/g.22142  ORF Transcript_7798/g.22142 Transcript_7798/m.22142 type:complete len:227 (+) Transcript_7798:359-1039(+)